MHSSSSLVLLTLFISLGMAEALQTDRTVNANKTAIIVYARARGYCNESMNEKVDDAYRPSLFRYDSALKKFSTPCKNMYGVIAYTWSYESNCNSTNNPLRITYEEMCIYPLPETPNITTIDEGADDQPQGISIGIVCLVISVIFCLVVLIVFAVKKNREKRSRPNSVLQLDSESREQVDRNLLNNYAVETTI